MSHNTESVHDGVFKALADPTRRKILRLLKEGELNAGDIGSHFKMSAPSVSHHLAALSGAGLIRVRREGAFLLYSLDTTVVDELVATFMDLVRGNQEQTS